MAVLDNSDLFEEAQVEGCAQWEPWKVSEEGVMGHSLTQPSLGRANQAGSNGRGGWTSGREGPGATEPHSPTAGSIVPQSSGSHVGHQPHK